MYNVYFQANENLKNDVMAQLTIFYEHDHRRIQSYLHQLDKMSREIYTELQETVCLAHIQHSLMSCGMNKLIVLEQLESYRTILLSKYSSEATSMKQNCPMLSSSKCYKLWLQTRGDWNLIRECVR